MRHEMNENITYFFRTRSVFNLKGKPWFSSTDNPYLSYMKFHILLGGSFNLLWHRTNKSLHINNRLFGNSTGKISGINNLKIFNDAHILLKYYPATNFTNALLVDSETARRHCTVDCCWRSKKKHCFPFALLVCSLPLDQIFLSMTDVPRSPTFKKDRSNFSWLWFITAFP